MKKIHVKVEVDLFLNVDEDVAVEEVINEMDYTFTSQTDGADIVDTTIIDFAVTDAR